MPLGFGLELGLLVVVAAVLIGVYLVLKSIKPLIVNAIVGLVVLLLAGVVGFGVEITPVIILIVAFGGVPGAILVLLLAHLGILFSPAIIGIPLGLL